MGLLRTIAIIVIIYYAFKFIGKYIMPILFKKVVENVEKKYKEQQQNQYREEDGKVGDTVISKKPSGKSDASKDVGDYIDYEEIKD